MSPLSAELAAEVARIVESCLVVPHFQPIVDLHSANIVGYEALIRGPSDSFLQSPVALLEAAAVLGQLPELEMKIVPLLVQTFTKLCLPGKLFINITPPTISGQPRFCDCMARWLAEAGLDPSRVVVELTETHAVSDHDALGAALARITQSGLAVAIDDLGEGFSGLKRWSQLRPPYVKIDRHFVDGLSQDPLRQQFIRSIMDMARIAGSQVVAEGVETESDLVLLHELGVHYAQGYLIARPAATPRTSSRPELVRLLRDKERNHWAGVDAARRTVAAQLARPTLTLPPETTCADVIAAFRSDPHLYAIPVLDADRRPIGVLRSHDCLIAASQLYFMDVFGRQSCRAIFDARPLIFDAHSSLASMAGAVVNVDERHLTDGFIVTEQGRYFGTGRISDLLRAVTDSELSAARYANPLTQLPGNVPLDEHVDALIDQRQSFIVAHWDIGSFKAFNDVYGYRLGDDMILLTAQILRKVHDAERDLLGHVGGDDFVSVFCSPDWRSRIESALSAFDRDVRRLYSAEHLRRGGYESLNRQGLREFHPLATLAAGVVPVESPGYESHRQIARAAAETKRIAKLGPGSRYFVERRQSRRALAPEPELEASESRW